MKKKMNSIEPLEYFENNYFSYSFQELRTIYKSLPPTDGFVRFFNHLEDFVFGVSTLIGEHEGKLLLLYAEYKKDFYSIAIIIPIEDYQFANDITVIMSKRICEKNLDKDFFNVYNLFQDLRVGALEALDYYTFNPFNTPKNSFLLSINQKIIPVEKINRVDFLRSIYGKTNDKIHLDPINKIYLMVDNRNGLIKIGKSKSPKYREGTLQSKEPEIHLICYWTASPLIEKELHIKYDKFRKRGEWFRLSLKELDEIKNFMDNLE